MPAAVRVPVFSIETVWAGLAWPTMTLPKSRLVGLPVSAPGASPVPLRSMIAGSRPGDVPEMVSLPLRVPAWLGLKMTCVEQVAPEARVVPQALPPRIKSPVI